MFYQAETILPVSFENISIFHATSKIFQNDICSPVKHHKVANVKTFLHQQITISGNQPVLTLPGSTKR